MSNNVTIGEVKQTAQILNERLISAGSKYGVVVSGRYGYQAIDTAPIKNGEVDQTLGHGTLKTALTKKEALTILEACATIVSFIPSQPVQPVQPTQPELTPYAAAAAMVDNLVNSIPSPSEWESLANGLTGKQNNELGNRLADVSVHIARLSAYLDVISLSDHDTAVKVQNNKAKKVRKALGFSYPEDNKSF